MKREQKKVKGLTKSCKAVSFYNGQSAAKSPRRERFNEQMVGIFESLLSHCQSIYMTGISLVVKIDMSESIRGVVYQIKNSNMYSISPLPKSAYPIRVVDYRKGKPNQS
ncbi:MAG: hypothetical protein F6K36_24110 [Symploca sp. SIO3C6]|nr:hypothetical protein [Symploca sp. SIO3C6]